MFSGWKSTKCVEIRSSDKNPKTNKEQWDSIVANEFDFTKFSLFFGL